RDSESLADEPLDPELLSEPLDHRLAEDPEGSRIGCQGRHQDPVELDEGLLVENDPVEILAPELASPEAELDGADRKVRVVLDAREAFLLGGGGHDAVLNQRGRGIVEEARDTQNVHVVPPQDCCLMASRPTPYPAPEGSRCQAVACRWPRGSEKRRIASAKGAMKTK